MQVGSKTIGVAMSTYNGAKYLVPQIESVLAQDVSDCTLIVRDDGSTDETLHILECYERERRLEVIRGNNVGVVSSFIGLIDYMAERFDYIALCDQDDVWHSDKLSRALSILDKGDSEIPRLYCSEYMFCDEDLNPIDRSHLKRGEISFQKMLYENRTSGNTMVINRALARLVSAGGDVGVYCHDWWISLLATSFGELLYDDFISLDYRRLSNNVSPTGASGIKLLRRRIRAFLENGDLERVTLQLQKLNDTFGTALSEDKRVLLELFLKGRRMRKCLFPHRLRETVPAEFAVRLLFLFGGL